MLANRASGVNDRRGTSAGATNPAAGNGVGHSTGLSSNFVIALVLVSQGGGKSEPQFNSDVARPASLPSDAQYPTLDFRHSVLGRLQGGVQEPGQGAVVVSCENHLATL